MALPSGCFYRALGAGIGTGISGVTTGIFTNQPAITVTGIGGGVAAALTLYGGCKDDGSGGGGKKGPPPPKGPGGPGGVIIVGPGGIIVLIILMIVGAGLSIEDSSIVKTIGLLLWLASFIVLLALSIYRAISGMGTGTGRIDIKPDHLPVQDTDPET